jgi:hypothetical protein
MSIIVEEEKSVLNYKDDNYRTWKFYGLDSSMRTLVRHALFADVPVQAVEKVTFLHWDGLVESSLIAHRMGQLPITGLAPLTFELNFKAPTDAPLSWATTEHITGDDGRVVRGIGPTSGGFLLVPLLAGQHVHLVCTTSLGTGRKRATWNSAFPVVNVITPKEFALVVETTGACTAKEALTSALQSSLDIFTHIV